MPRLGGVDLPAMLARKVLDAHACGAVLEALGRVQRSGERMVGSVVLAELARFRVQLEQVVAQRFDGALHGFVFFASFVAGAFFPESAIPLTVSAVSRAPSHGVLPLPFTATR